MKITCYSSNGRNYSWYIKKKDALRAGLKFEFKFFSIMTDGEENILSFHKEMEI